MSQWSRRRSSSVRTDAVRPRIVARCLCHPSARFSPGKCMATCARIAPVAQGCLPPLKRSLATWAFRATATSRKSERLCSRSHHARHTVAFKHPPDTDPAGSVPAAYPTAPKSRFTFLFHHEPDIHALHQPYPFARSTPPSQGVRSHPDHEESTSLAPTFACRQSSPTRGLFRDQDD